MSPASNPLWYKEAIFYETRVGAFYDSNGDGIGDFPGLTQKLDYFRDMGVTALWILPFYPSPMKDDGYDISDYCAVHPDFGTLQDFRLFLKEAHKRGLKVVTELVLNHTSDQHEWFKRAKRSAPASALRDFYVWSKTPDKYKGTRIIFKDYESSNWAWDPQAQAYYWHRFYSHQPDLNFDNPLVRKAMLAAVDFWLGMGVDGLRLDAVPYLFEREATPCENLPETHSFLKELRAHVEKKFADRMLLAEANQWPEDAAAYYGAGDECHTAFHFPIMPRLFMAIYMEDRFPVLDILQQTPAIPETCQWMLFLRNHDELTLEMVTDEERDYMYQVYARDPQARLNLGIRRRLAPLLGNNRRKMELMNGLLFSLPGTPILYYGDELGMGDNIYLGDRNGVRTPFHWSADKNAGFSRANPQKLYLPVIVDPEYHYEAVNAEAQQNNLSSLWWWMKRLIALRKRYKSFGLGTIEFLYPRNPKVLAFIRRHENEAILVVANLSRFVEYVELDLSSQKGMVPVELFGKKPFPPIGELPYLLTLGPHSFYWFTLEAPKAEVPAEPAAAGPVSIAVPGKWEGVFQGEAREGLERAVADFLRSARWFGGKARKISAVRLTERIPLPGKDGDFHLCSVLADYSEGSPESYLLPLSFARGERAEELRKNSPSAVVALVREKSGEGMLYDACIEKNFGLCLLEAFSRKKSFKGLSGELRAVPGKEFGRLLKACVGEPSLLKGEQSNTSILFGDKLIFKLYRKLGEGPNPDLEIVRFLTEKSGFAHVPPMAGFLEYRRPKAEPLSFGILQEFIANEGNAWQHTSNALGRFYEGALAQPQRDPSQTSLPPLPPLKKALEEEIPSEARERIGAYLESAGLMGKRTAEMHLALLSDPADPAFSPEPFTPHYQRALYQSFRNLLGKNIRLLRDGMDRIPEAFKEKAQKAVSSEGRILKRFQSVIGLKTSALRTRHHGDFHLGQLLYTGKDFFILDFEGEPARSFSDRRIKRSPLRDAAGMLRSFHYAATAGLQQQTASGLLSLQGAKSLEEWARFWRFWVSAAYLKAYLEAAGSSVFVPQSREELFELLSLYQLEKAVYELGYELNHRPDWIRVPLDGILSLLEEE